MGNISLWRNEVTHSLEGGTKQKHYNSSIIEFYGFLETVKNEDKELDDEIIKLIEIDYKITTRQMVAKLGISKARIERCISKSSKIKYIGPKKGGHWEVYD